MTDGVNGPDANASDNRTVVDPNAASGANATGDWLAGLEADNRSLVDAKQWKTTNDALKSYRELESHASKALSVPGEAATADDWNKFYEKLGRPATADKYEIRVDRATLPADFPYDETLATNFRTWAHENGLSPKQAQGLHDKWVSQMAGGFTANNERITGEQNAAHRELTDKWGDPNSEGYKREVEMMSRAAHQLGIKDSFVKGGLLTADGGVRDAKLAFALARIGKELFSEDSFANGDGAGVLSNPWSDGKANITEQGRLVRHQPDKARALIRAAGKDPSVYGL